MTRSGYVDQVKSASSEVVIRLLLRTAVELYVLGTALFLGSDPWASPTEAIFPTRAQVSSHGTFFRPFEAVGASIIRRMGAVLVLGSIAVLVVDRVDWAPPTSTTWAALLGVAALMLTGGGSGTADWPTPRNGFFDNSQVYWADFLTKRSDDLFCAAGRLHHELFLDVAFWWQAVSVAWVIGLCCAIGHRLGFLFAAVAATVAMPIVATNLWSSPTPSKTSCLMSPFS